VEIHTEDPKLVATNKSKIQQQKTGKKTLEIGFVPQATVHSSLVALAWFAWHSMPAPNELRSSNP